MENSLTDCLEPFLPDSVVTDIQELNRVVNFKHVSQSSGSIDIKSVLEQIESLERGILLKGLCDQGYSIDSKMILAQVQKLDGLVLL